jgi:mannose-6-phosphate isomerase class I
VRPWFEPGTWGGHWIKENIPQLPQAGVPNYAWSFEMIAPENGLVFESSGRRLEVSFDMLMYQHSENVLGGCAGLFGEEFPIRFDFLDTVDGGNLSVQCHPGSDFIYEQFGEHFTQDETYYILDSTPEAKIYLGFQDDINPEAFRKALERSECEGEEIDVRRFVQTHPAEKHDLFLIPNGTIHCSGEGNLVLEISATPYIFTFKLYDWRRLGLDGEPRPINIERGFENLRFERKGERVQEELIPEPQVIDAGNGWQLMHLPTHAEHFYDVHRFDFEDEVEATTDGSPHVLNVVEGRSVILETEHGPPQRFNYAETFAIPAAAERYRLTNEGDAPAKVVKAFVKPEVTPESDIWQARVFTERGA